MTPAEEKAYRARFKPKVEPTTELMSPLYDLMEEAIQLIDCAYFATRCPGVIGIEEAGEGIRGALDEGLKRLRETKDALHDMVTWA